ncbi:polysaccharide deacetylase family protein [Bacillus mangrovi]|uniref:Polysaccharide deacetylase family protein n=1 Tax=Metabacillus mangrovi TaxID=1491830 RepID=A0A7X2V599_9BACI|nr:polysaccharide deacetylase family protein [Metabacillus mangrovi]MTH54582.1 polysaccharide deacetylase family protein [Metabacillus mangrovi]
MQKVLFVLGSCLAVILFLLPYCYEHVKAALEQEPVLTSESGDTIHDIAQLAPPRNFHLKGDDRAKSVPVLLYHRILASHELAPTHYGADGTLSSTLITADQFKKQMNYLQANHYTTLSLSEFKAFMISGEPVPEKSVLITFDDGHKDNMVHAYPILRKNEQRAALFLITSEIRRSKEGYYPEKVQFASAPELETAADVFDYASHTHDYHQTDQQNAAFLVSRTEKEIVEDLNYSIAMLGGAEALAYPYGEKDRESVHAARKAGFQLGFSVNSGTAVPGKKLMEIPRNVIQSTTSMEDFIYLIEQNSK